MSKSWEDKRLFTEQVIENVLDLDIAKVLDTKINLVRKGYQYTALCPFHNDNHYGNFMISSSKGIYKCFACGEGGNAISFIMKTEGVNFVQAVYNIALEHRLISEDEYEENFGSRKYSLKEINSIEMNSISKKIKPEVEIKSEEERNLVYSAFLDVLSSEFREGLLEEDWQYLLETRKIPMELIQIRRYRSLQFSQYMRQKISALLLERLEREDLIGIPGFYQEKVKGEWVWSFPGNKGILIPIVNAKGQVVAFQIRKKEVKEGMQRYSWISSAFTVYREDLFQNGSSPGSPLDVVFPENVHHSALFITEGRFKSESILKNFNAPCISTQGVGNWKGIEKEVDEIFLWMDSEHKIYNNKQIVIVYDSDMQFNYAVFLQFRNLVDHLRKYYPKISIKTALWEYADESKGIDDYIETIFSKKGEIDKKKDFFFIEAENWIKIMDREIARYIKEERLENEWKIDPHVFKHTMKDVFKKTREQANI